MTVRLKSDPVRIMSKANVASRMKRLRISWFLLGAASGIAASFLMSALFSASPMSAVGDLPRPPSLETPVSQLGEEPETQAIADLPNSSANANLYPVTVELKVAGGDTLLNMLLDTGIKRQEAYDITEALKKKYDARKLDMDQSVTVQLDRSEDDPETPTITSLLLPLSSTSQIRLERKTAGFEVTKVDKPTKRQLARSGGVITSSLYETAVDSGIPATLVGEIISAYSYDVDFQRDIHDGDSVDVMFDKIKTDDGQLVGYGNILYASLILNGKEMRIYRYTDKAGMSDYYNEKGESVRKALLRTPINGARISSGFGMRKHPILGYSKMHKGMDFAAPTGTPIYAAGDGVVEMAGVSGSYGNYLRIKHTSQYASAYGHISKFAKGIRAGMKVRQGQVVAYVGSTGRSTGPHLHYEVLMSGAQVNPSSIKFKTGTALSGRELAAFHENVKQVQTRLAELAREKMELAQADVKR